MSGINNSYFHLNPLYELEIVNHLYNSMITPIQCIRISTSRSDLSKIRMIVKLNPKLHDGYPENLQIIRNAFDRVKNYGVVSDDPMDETPLWCSNWTISDYNNIRPVIQILVEDELLIPSYYESISASLKEIDRCIEFASHQQDKMEKAQSKVLKSVISPYLEEIITELPDVATAKYCLERASLHVTFYGSRNSPTAQSLKYSMEFIDEKDSADHPELEASIKRYSDAFYDSLLSLARIWSCMADMESTFQRLAEDGKTIPSQKLIQDFIVDKIEKEFSKKETK
jgi:hypothetical protein